MAWKEEIPGRIAEVRFNPNYPSFQTTGGNRTSLVDAQSYATWVAGSVPSWDIKDVSFEVDKTTVNVPLRRHQHWEKQSTNTRLVETSITTMIAFKFDFSIIHRPITTSQYPGYFFFLDRTITRPVDYRWIFHEQTGSVISSPGEETGLMFLERASDNDEVAGTSAGWTMNAVWSMSKDEDFTGIQSWRVTGRATNYLQYHPSLTGLPVP